jgi:hypothetical protein
MLMYRSNALHDEFMHAMSCDVVLDMGGDGPE